MIDFKGRGKREEEYMRRKDVFLYICLLYSSL